MDFMKNLKSLQDEINENLESVFPKEKVLEEKLIESMRYSLLAGGKRIRPALMILTCEALGGKREDVMPFALAIEMIHTYSLIHDDLPSMDNDDLRRGMPTNHKVYGEALAILSGDALLTNAFLVASKANVADDKKVKAIEILADMAGTLGMVGGQVIDLEGEERRLSLDELSKMHAKKTGALIRASVSIGALIAGYDKDYLDDYAKNLGLAFQLCDDILDVEASTEELGKNAGSDDKNEKSTFIKLLGIEKTKEMLIETTNKAIASLDKIEDSKALVEMANYLLKRKA